jgi:hypothetical protein
MFKKLLLAVAGLALLASATPVVRADSDLDFILANKTGYGIKAVYVAPTTSKNWGDNILGDVLDDGQQVAITFHPKAANIQKWDLMITWEEDGYPDEYWTGYKLSDISKITLHYNRKTDQTSAEVE